MAFVKNVYSKEIIVETKEKSVTSVFRNNRYSENKTQGTSVEFEKIPSIQSRNYDDNVGMTWDTLDVTNISLALDQYKYFATRIKSIDAFISNTDLQEKVATGGAETIANDQDKYIFKTIRDNAGNTIDLSGVTITKANVLDVLFQPLVTIFNKNHVSPNMRNIFVTAELDAIIRNADISQRLDGISGANYTGSVMGINVFYSTLLPTNSTDPTKNDMVASDTDAVAFETSLSKIDLLPYLEKYTGSAVRGEYVYGCKVLDNTKTVKIIVA